MDERIGIYQELAALFLENGRSLYLVGGTVRDHLLGKPLDDMDAVTDALPEEMKKFLPEDSDYTFSRFGCVKVHFHDVKFDVTTMREEKRYLDSRRPSEITFIRDLSVDVKRRDFTLNALYLSPDGEVLDFVGGKSDLENGLLRMVGDPETRLQEDPLRIIRAFRFSATFGFTFEKSLDDALRTLVPLLKKLNPDKIRSDLNKTGKEYRGSLRGIVKKYDAAFLLDMIK